MYMLSNSVTKLVDIYNPEFLCEQKRSKFFVGDIINTGYFMGDFL